MSARSRAGLLPVAEHFVGGMRREAIHDRRSGCPPGRPKPGAVALHHRVHCLLCGVDDLFDHRHPDQEGPGPQRHPVRPAGRHADPDRLADPPDARHLGRPIRRTHRLRCRHAVGGGRDLAADLRLRLPDVPAGGARRRHRRRLVRGRHHLRVQVVSEGEPGHRARHLRRRQRRCGRHQVRRSLHHGCLRLEDRRQRLGDRDRAHGRRLLADDQGRPAARGAPAQRGQARVASGHAGALEEHPGVALLALLFLRVRRLRGARAVAAALPDRRLRPRHHHRRHDRCRLLGPGKPVPRLWRRAVRQIRRAPHHVLDVRHVRRLLLCPVLPADRVRGAGHSRTDELPAGNRPCRLHRDRLRAGLLHEPRQGGGLQAHPRLLPAARGLGRRRRRPGRWARRFRPSDPVRCAQRSHGRVAELLHGSVRPLRAGSGLDASVDPSHGEGRLRRAAQEASRAARDAGDP